MTPETAACRVLKCPVCATKMPLPIRMGGWLLDDFIVAFAAAHLHADGDVIVVVETESDVQFREQKH